MLKRSSDGGISWGAQTLVWDDGPNTCGNPCAVVDQQTGVIWLLLTHNGGADTQAAIQIRTAGSPRTVWVCHSRDTGQTWSKPVEITGQTKDPAWGWYATGPGRTLQAGFAAYSCLVAMPDGKIGCLYERGDQNARERITFASFPPDWLNAGKALPAVR